MSSLSTQTNGPGVPLTTVEPDDYPRLSREGLGALKFNWRKANVEDDWTKGGHLSEAWDRVSGWPYWKKPSYDLDYAMRVVAKIAQEVPAWREVVGRVAALGRQLLVEVGRPPEQGALLRPQLALGGQGLLDQLGGQDVVRAAGAVALGDSPLAQIRLNVGSGLLVVNEGETAPDRADGNGEPDGRQGRNRRVALRPLPDALVRPGGPGHDRLTRQEPPQVVRQGCRRFVAPGRFFLQALQADRFEVAGYPRLHGARPPAPGTWPARRCASR